MKKIKMLFVTFAAFTLTIAAFINAASACTFIHYQPNLPKSLRE